MLATDLQPGVERQGRFVRPQSRAREEWSSTPISQRLHVVRRARHWLAENAASVAATVARPSLETLTSEVLPLLEACRFLETEAERILAPQMPGVETQPLWLRGTSLKIVREPVGTVLVIGPSNYPLFLPGVQLFQALTAGNSVILKPGRSGSAAAQILMTSLVQGGLAADVVKILSEDPASAEAAIDQGVDLVVLTGSVETGRVVGERLARTGTPSIMELSGEDPVLILESADPELVIKALRFATTLNSGNTCIAPRRLYLAEALAQDLLPVLERELSWLPVKLFSSDEEGVRLANDSPYALGAVIFGRTQRAQELALALRAGVVVVNDVIMPTADPRLPFGGRAWSGWGATRGEEGLRQLTVQKAIVVRQNRWRPHLEKENAGDENLFLGYISGMHSGSWLRRWAGWRRTLTSMLERRKGQTNG